MVPTRAGRNKKGKPSTKTTTTTSQASFSELRLWNSAVIESATGRLIPSSLAAECVDARSRDHLLYKRDGRAREREGKKPMFLFVLIYALVEYMDEWNRPYTSSWL